MAWLDRYVMRVALVAAVVLSVVFSAPTVVLAQPGEATTAPPPPLPKAWILVDADTGAVIDSANDRTPVPPASTIKLFTALVAAQRLPDGCSTPISARAEAMPARKINAKAGQTWLCDDLFKVMLLASANDAAVALAEQVGGGTLDGWVSVAQATADRLGLQDDPLLVDPAGLDDEFSNYGGSRISARDLAIVARAALAEPDVMNVVAMPEYYFETGGDGLPHKVTNHNRFLREYAGATGLKTGATELAGRTFVASATREGRTMIVVEFDAADIYLSAALLLDRGFATPVEAQAGLPLLPRVTPDAAIDPPATTVPLVRIEPAVQAASPDESSGFRLDLDSPVTAGLVFVLGILPLTVVARSRRRRSRLHEIG